MIRPATTSGPDVMSGYEVPTPILNSPSRSRPSTGTSSRASREPCRAGRPACTSIAIRGQEAQGRAGTAIELKLVNRIRQQVDAWRTQGYPGVTRTTLDLLHWWRRDGRQRPLFFAQLEAAETIIFLDEARADFRQGINIPREEPGPRRPRACRLPALCLQDGHRPGKTTVMGMMAAWSILNKVNDRGDARFSDVVLVVCPNVTIRNRLAELDPGGARRASTARATWCRRTDARPDAGPRAGDQLARLRAAGIQTGGTNAKVNKAGVPLGSARRSPSAPRRRPPAAAVISRQTDSIGRWPPADRGSGRRSATSTAR